MGIRSTIAVILLLAAPVGGALAQGTDNPFRLKPGAKGKVCLSCHSQFQETLKRPVLHTPVRNGECSDCHSPHASSHGRLLAAEPEAICLTCHAGIVASGAKSAHPDAASGRCIRCHEPHASANKSLLLDPGNPLCLTCHKEIAERLEKAKYRHVPATRSCIACHDPHAAKDNDSLLRKPAPDLCTGCHKTGEPAFKTAHMGYPVGSSDCVSCHDPHASSQPGLLLDSVHGPVAARNCGQCHYEATSPNALKVRREGVDGCRGCHSEMLNETLVLNRVHWPVLDHRACRNCHRPHASKFSGLLVDSQTGLCGRCHPGTVRQAGMAQFKHTPVDEGNCSTCHAPHGSNTPLLLTAADSTAVCAGCHNYSTHTSHPMGLDVVDPRNRNTRVDCLSCHNTHGSAHKYLTWQDKKMDLCLLCHEDFRR